MSPDSTQGGPKCIYCGAVLDDSTEDAHVFPAGLGGRLKSRTYCCTTCNHVVAPLESELILRLQQTSALVGGVDRSNKPVKAIVDHGGRQWRASAGRLHAIAPPPRREANHLIVPLGADPDEQARVIARILRKRGWPAEALIDGRFTFSPGEPDPPPPAAPVEGTVRLGDVITKRAIAKIGLELVGYFDVPLARHRELSMLRRFVKYGTDVATIKLERWSEGSGLWEVCNRNWDAVPFRHSVEAWTFARNLHYRVTLFSRLHLGGLLGSGIDEHFAALYVFDVRKPANHDLVCERRDGTAPPIWTDDVTVEQLEAASKHVEDETRRIYGDSPRHVRAPEPDATDLYERVKKLLK